MARQVTDEATLRKLLLEGIAHFGYYKKDGSLREAYGTLNADIIDQQFPGKNQKHGKVEGEFRNYFDVEKVSWRKYSVNEIAYIDTDYGA